MEAFADVLRGLVVLLGMTIEYVFDVYTRQQILSGGVEFLDLVGLVLLTYFTARWSCNYYLTQFNPLVSRDEYHGYSYDDYLMEHKLGLLTWASVGGLVTFLVGLLLLVCLGDSLLHIINPQYYAIQEMLKAAKGK